MCVVITFWFGRAFNNYNICAYMSVLNIFSINLFLSLDCFWLLDLLLDFTSNQIISPVLKDLSSGPPKPSESLPERMDGKETVALLQWWFKQLDTDELYIAAAIIFPLASKGNKIKPH